MVDEQRGLELACMQLSWPQLPDRNQEEVIKEEGAYQKNNKKENGDK